MLAFLRRLFSRHPKKTAGTAAGAIALATALVASFEGYVPYVYRDGGGVRTYCYGETQNPEPGRKYTRRECDALLAARIREFDQAVTKCVHVALPEKTRAAFVSFAYNVGPGAFCSSTLARLANAGDLAGACNQLPRWNHDNGRVVKGLTIRRGKERALCLEGVQ